MLRRQRERGDTIIEVLFAFTVFSLLAIGGLSLMNQGTALAQRALEIGLVRQQIDAQADALRYLNRSYIADYGKRGAATEAWKRVVTDHAVTGAQDFTKVAESERCAKLPNTVFALDLKKLSADPVIAVSNPSDYDPLKNTEEEQPTYARVRYDLTTVEAQGLWIEAVGSPVRTGVSDGNERPGFYDFHIRACWNSPGQDAPVTLGTIVRLYEPRG